MKIAKTELQMLFYSPVAWLILIIFTFQSGLVFSEGVSRMVLEKTMGWKLMGVSTNIFVRVLYSMQEYLFLYIPILTMGLVSRDLAGGTMKLLHSSPMTNAQIILGKYLSMMIFALVLVGIFLVYLLFLLCFVENVDVLTILSGIFGIYLLICTYAAIGLFMSSVSSYQIIAAIGTLTILSFLNYINQMWQEIAFVRDVTFWLSIRGRTGGLIGGLICSEDLIYFIMVPAMFVTFAIIHLSSRVKHVSWGKNAMKYAGVFLIIACVGYLSSRPRLMGFVDVSREKGNTLTPHSQEIVKLLKGGLTITTYNNLMDRDYMKALPQYVNSDKYSFWRYIRFKPEIKLKYVYYYDTVVNKQMENFYPELSFEDRARRFAGIHKLKFSRYLSPEQIRSVIDLRPEGNYFVRQIERESGEKMFLRLYNDMFRDPGEAEISAAFKRMVMELPTVGFLTGHGERNINREGDRDYIRFAQDKWFRQALVNQGFDVQEVELTGEIPAVIKILVIADMRKELTDEEKEKLDRYIERGGNLVLIGENGYQKYMNSLVEPLGVSFVNGVLVQPSENYSPDMVLSRPTPESWELSYYFKGMAKWNSCATMPGCMGLEYVTDKGFTVTPLLVTDSTGVWNELETTNFIDDTVKLNPAVREREQRYVTALALSRKIGEKEQKIVVLGDADCISNIELFKRREEIRAENYYIILGSFHWLSDGEAPVDVRRPLPIDNDIFLGKEGAKITKVAFTWVIPGLILLLALLVWIRRRSR